MLTRLYPLRARAAFTLIELLVVLSIIAILSLIALPNFSEAQTRARVATVANNMRVQALKFEMLKVDTNHYPTATKWRWILFWRVPTWESGGDDIYEKFDLFYKNMFGPHQDLFEWEWLKRSHVQDLEWLGVNDQRKHFNNGFCFFHPKFTLEGIDGGATWQGLERHNWEVVSAQAGEWLMYSPGPDLMSHSPAWIDVPGWGYGETGDSGYVERELFIEYDPTNGTMSNGNIFRTQRNAGGLGFNSYFYER